MRTHCGTILAAALAAFGCGRPTEAATLVAHPDADCWESPSFRGRPFWPLFAKLSHSESNAPHHTSIGLEGLPLTQEYASTIVTHGFHNNIARYRRSGKGTGGGYMRADDGKKIYCEPTPEKERLAGSYTLRDMFGPGLGDFVCHGDWTARQLWNPQKGSPFLLQDSGSRPPFFLDGEDRGDKADFAEWLKAHPSFLGFKTMEEIDSDAANYRVAMRGGGRFAELDPATKADLASRFPPWKDRRGFLDTIRRCWEVEKRHHFGCDRFWPLYCNNHTLSHIMASLGAVGLICEVSSSQGSPWAWSGAYTRGASRQWGIPFAWYCATFYRGFKRGQAPGTQPFAGDNKWPRDGKHTRKRPAYCGASLSLTARQKYYGWLIGAAFIQDEVWTMLCRSASEDGTPCPSPYAKVFNAVFERSRRIDRGAPYTPIALLTPLAESFSRGGYVDGLQDENGLCADLLNIPAYLLTLQPVYETSPTYPMLSERRRHGDEGCLFNSQYGEIWDVLTADSGQDTDKFASALAHYPAAFLIGSYRKGEVDVAALERYVLGGGTLFLSADYVEEGIVPSSLAGVSFGEGRVTSGGRLVDERGSEVASLGGAYLLHEAVLAETARVLLRDENGTAVAAVRALGRGRIVTTCCTRSMPAVYFKCRYRFDDATHRELRQRIISGGGNLGLIRYLLERIQGETMPLRVEGDIQWGLGKNAKGWLLWLINNKGISKYYGEPADVDETKTAEVTVSLDRLGGLTPRNADTGEALQVTGDAFTVKVGPGDVAFVQIGK